MSISCSAERSLLNHDELTIINKTHYPLISDLTLDELKTLQKDLRLLRDKQKTHLFRLSRVSRGKEAAHGSRSAGYVPHSTRRKQVFAQALKRTGRELERLAAFEAKTSLVNAQYSALALRRKNLVQHHPATGWSGNSGMQAKLNPKKKRATDRRKLGRVLQQNSVAQARRDG